MVGGQLLFQVISECYETKSLIITTNLEFSKWVNIFYDQEMTICCILKMDKVARGIPESCKQEFPKIARNNCNNFHNC